MTLPELRPYQRACVDFVKTRPGSGLFLPMGLGKSLVTLTALYELNPPHHVLVIGPKPVVESTWPAECEKWGFPIRFRSLTKDEKGRRLSKDDRHALYRDVASMPPTVWTLNREMVTDLVLSLPGRWRGKPNESAYVPEWPFGTLVIDESQSFKSYSSRRFKLLQPVVPQTERRILLSGTPNPQGLEDLWSQLYLIDGGVRLGDCITRFREAFMLPGHVKNPETGYPVGWTPRPGAEDEVFDRISDVVVSLRALEGVIPPETVIDVPVEISPKERALYERFKRDAVLEFADDEGHVDAVAVNAAVLASKLQQMASGTIYLEDGTYEVIHSRKMPVLDAIVDYAGSPVLVAYKYRSDLAELTHHFEGSDVSFEVFDGTPEMVERWNARKISVMAIQPQAAGHGLNLQFGGHTLVWYTLDWALEPYLQCNARLTRSGQADPVQVYRLITRGTNDERVAERLADKNVSQQALLDAVRAEYGMGEERIDL